MINKCLFLTNFSLFRFFILRSSFEFFCLLLNFTKKKNKLDKKKKIFNKKEAAR